MKPRARAIALVVIQCLLVSSIAAKYLCERATCPRVWVRVAQFDPNLPMRGRYLGLSPIVDACTLPHDRESASRWTDTNGHERVSWHWQVRAYAHDGKLVVEDARNVLPHTGTQTIWLNGDPSTGDTSCDHARLSAVDFFIPDTAQSPFPLKKDQELWTEVTVPPLGPPRPIQLAISSSGEWKALNLN
jgi:hypothetical protein